MLGRAVIGKVCWRRANNVADLADAHRHLAAIRQVADPHRKIDRLIVKVDHPVLKLQPHLDFGIGFQEIDDHRR